MSIISCLHSHENTWGRTISNHHKRAVVKQTSKQISRARNQPTFSMQLNQFKEVIVTGVPALSNSKSLSISFTLPIYLPAFLSEVVYTDRLSFLPEKNDIYKEQ